MNIKIVLVDDEDIKEPELKAPEQVIKEFNDFCSKHKEFGDAVRKVREQNGI